YARSAGAITLASIDPTVSPIIDFDYFSNADDLTRLRAISGLAGESARPPAAPRWPPQGAHPPDQRRPGLGIGVRRLGCPHGDDRSPRFVHLSNGPVERSAGRGGRNRPGLWRRQFTGSRCVDLPGL